MPRPTLREATLADLDTLVAHRRGMFRDMGHGTRAELDAADPVYRAWARRMMRSGRLVGWIVRVGGEPVASGCVWLQDVQPRPGAPGPYQPYLLSMFTEPAWRGRGFAERIVKRATAWAKKGGHRRMTLHAAPMGRRLYARLGWERGWEMSLRLKPPARARSRRAARSR